MATHKRTWKKAEARVASLFGAMRQPLSGSGNRPDRSRSDSTHPTLFVEAKFREKHAVRTLHDRTKALAREEGKVPVLALIDKNRPGFLVCVHSDDIAAVAAELAKMAATPEPEPEHADAGP